MSHVMKIKGVGNDDGCVGTVPDRMRAVRIFCLLSIVGLFGISAPSHACSIVWSGYEHLTEESDALVVVEANSVSGLRAVSETNPFQPTAEGSATGRIDRQLMGRRLPAEISFEYWSYDPETSCGIDFNVTPGRTYYLWLKRQPDGQLHTWYGQDAADISTREKNLIASYARR